MRFKEFCHSLGGQPQGGYEDYFHLPRRMTLSQIGHVANGAPGIIETAAPRAWARVRVEVEEGAAIIIGAVDRQEILDDAEIFLIRSTPDRQTPPP